jgi:hypothetical protein
MPADSVEHVDTPRAASRIEASSPFRDELKSLYEDSAKASSSASSERIDKLAASLEFDTAALYPRLDLAVLKSSTGSDIFPRSLDATALGQGFTPEKSLTVKAGDTLESIAAARLSADASPAERKAFLNAVRAINNLPSGIEPAAGSALKLPERMGSGWYRYSGDGLQVKATLNGITTVEGEGFKIERKPGGITHIKEGNTEIITEDTTRDTTTIDHATGRKVLTRSDNSTVVTEKVADGELVTRKDPAGRTTEIEQSRNGLQMKMTFDENGSTAVHFDPKPERRMTVKENLAGEIQVKDKDSDRIQTFRSDEALSAPRAELMELARKHLTDPLLLSRFKAEMVRFEDRTAMSNLPASEVAGTYAALSAMLKGGPDAKLPAEARKALALQVISQAARPSTVDQGELNTCSVASLENVMYATQPSRVAQVVSDIALTGKFQDSSGRTIEFSEQNLKPIGHSSSILPKEIHRSYASHLFQVGALSAVLAGENLKFEQTTGAGEGVREEIIDGNGTRRIFGGLYEAGIRSAFRLMSGDDRSDLILANSIAGEHFSANFVGFDSPESLAARLTELKEAGRLPVITVVNSSRDPIAADARNTSARQSWHAMVIKDFDKTTGTVMLDNQWGSRTDKPISLDRFFFVSSGPRRVPE